MAPKLVITSPKQKRPLAASWRSFFPYYAGYSEEFALNLLRSADLPPSSIVLDPWNGSGTTTFAAMQLGLTSIGEDINPTMVIVAKARSLQVSEADSLTPLAKAIVDNADRTDSPRIEDSLHQWFDLRAVSVIRRIERSLRRQLVGHLSARRNDEGLMWLSPLAATYYCALFSVCRNLVRPFRSTNPTWIKVPKVADRRVSIDPEEIERRFVFQIESMARAYAAIRKAQLSPNADSVLYVADSTKDNNETTKVDFVLTSPPYCTRIDYAVASRIELAVIEELLPVNYRDLGREMLGSVRVNSRGPVPQVDFGPTCGRLLDAIRAHPSKASSGYYYFTHFDYFLKLRQSMTRISKRLKSEGTAVLVVQDSYYKELHNNLPEIVSEMAALSELCLVQREDFALQTTRAARHPHAKKYERSPGAVEAVLCFTKAS